MKTYLKLLRIKNLFAATKLTRFGEQIANLHPVHKTKVDRLPILHLKMQKKPRNK